MIKHSKGSQDRQKGVKGEFRRSTGMLLQEGQRGEFGGKFKDPQSPVPVPGQDSGFMSPDADFKDGFHSLSFLADEDTRSFIFHR